MKVASLLILAVATSALKVQNTVHTHLGWEDTARPTHSAKQNNDGPATVDFNAVKEQHGKAVFYAVIMGKQYTRRHQVSLWLSSLRNKKMGNWDGEAIIVTDKPKCLEKTLEETNMLGKKDELRSTEFVDIYGAPEGMTGDLHIVKRPHTGSINKIKLEKARAWINFRNAGIEGKVGLIVYTDEDMVMGKDVHNFVAEATSYVPDDHTLALFRDTGASAGELHTGVVVIYNNDHSKTCLKAWGKSLTGLDIDEWRNENDAAEQAAEQEEPAENSAAIDATPKLVDDSALRKEVMESDESDADADSDMEQEGVMGPDQQALGRTHDCKTSEEHKGIKIMPREYFWFPTAAGLNKGKTAEFVHFTNTGRWRSMKGKIGDYIKGLGGPENIDPSGYSYSEECAIKYSELK